MARTDFRTVDEYIGTFPKDTQAILERIRKTIQKAVPDAEEVISYQIPAFKFHGWIFYFSAYQDHYSLSCPPPFTVFEEFKQALLLYEVTKSAIKFPLDQPVPASLIAKMSKYRAQQNLDRENAKAKRK